MLFRRFKFCTNQTHQRRRSMIHRSYAQIEASSGLHQSCFSHQIFFKDEIYQWRQYSGQDLREIRYGTDILTLADSMILVHREGGAIKFSAVDLSLICLLGPREVTISRSHPFLEHSNLSIVRDYFGVGSCCPACAISWIIFEEDTP